MPKRYLLVLSNFLLSVLLYVDRAAISVAKDSIMGDLELSNTQMGWVMSAFSLGYALCQTPSGMLADKFGPRVLLSSVVGIWSIFTALTGAAFNFISLLVYRLLFGAGEAGAFPGISRSVYPKKERGLITGINFSGSRMGGAFAYPAMVWMIVTFGWRESFYFLGAIGIGWAVFWWFWFRNTPEEVKTISDKELEYILENRQQRTESKDQKPIRLSRLLVSRNMWLAMIQYFCSNFTFFFCLTWLFPHLKSQFDLTLESAAIYTMLPLIGGAFCNWFSGWMGGFIYARGHWRLSRKIPAIMGFALAAVGLVGSMGMSDVNSAIILFTLAIFGADMTLSPSWSFCVDIGKHSAGTVSGTMNMAGNIGAFLTALAFPYLQEFFGSTEPFFYLGAGLNVLAIILWTQVQPDVPIE